MSEQEPKNGMTLLPTSNKWDEGEVVRVDFAFRRELAKKIEGNLANYCYQCGACVGDCAGAAYSESFNPRQIMLKVLYGLGDELLRENSIVWTCTNCYNCHERCPQQVKPVEVIISLKNMLADRGIYPQGVDKVIGAFEKTGRTVPMSAAVDRQREKYSLPPLKKVPKDEIAALISETYGAEATAMRPRLKEVAPRAEEGKRFAFFPGCFIPTKYPAMEFSIRESLRKLGVEMVDLDTASCCPDPIYFKSKNKISWLTVAGRNLSLAEDLGLDIITNCSGCTATLSEARHLLEDPELRERVNQRLRRIGREYQGRTRIRHIATIARDVIGPEKIAESVVRPLEGLKVAIHYGCHLLKPSKIMQVDDPNNPSMMEKLLSALGAETVRHANWSLCCGKACQEENVSPRMMRDLLKTVHDEKADLLCLICPTCFGQFDHGQVKVGKQFGEDFHTPPIYFFQLLAFAQGVPYEELGFERFRLKPECLKQFSSC